MIRRHLTYANVMVTLLAFIVLGGVGYAATALPKNSVGTRQLKKKAVATGKIKRGAVTGAKVKNGSLTGADIDASTLGTVPAANSAAEAQHALSAEEAASAEALAGLPSSAFAASDRFRFASRLSSSTSHLLLFDLPGGVRVLTDGDLDEEFDIYFENTSADTWLIATPGVTYPLAPGVKGTVPIAGALEHTALVSLQDEADTDKAVSMQCANFDAPARISCFATLSPEL